MPRSYTGGGAPVIGPSTSSTFTAGSVIVAGASTLSQNNASFFWDDTNTQLKLTAGAATKTPLKILLAASQTADALQVMASDGTTKLAKITANGTIRSGDGAIAGAVIVDQGDGAGSFVSLQQTGSKAGLLRGGLDHFVYYDTTSGDTVVDCVTGANLDLRKQGTTVARFDSSATAGNTRMLIYDVDNATLERVSVGAADSGGVGYKVLRIPN